MNKTGLYESSADNTAYTTLLEQAAAYGVDYIRGIQQQQPFPGSEALQGLEALEEELPIDGTDGADVIRMLHEIGAPGTTATIGGRFFGFVNGGLLPAAHAAEWLVDTWNQNTALYAMSPTASHIEAICERWVVELLGLEPQTAMGLVTGSSNAIICALAAARNELLRRQGYDLAKRGLRNAPLIQIVMSDDAHSVVKSALSILGIGEDEVTRVETDDMGRMRVDALPVLDASTLLIVQAGNVNGGAFDPIDELCDIAARTGAWVHVDGAFGLWAGASRTYRTLTRGMEKADSWSVDAHKTLNAGYDCGIVLCRHRDALVSALQASGAYIEYGAHRDGMSYTTEMSRRARAVPLWAVLKTLGANGVEAFIDRLCSHAAYFAAQLQNVGYDLINPPCFNQFMIACRTDEETERVLKGIQESGICWCSGSSWKGRRIIRVSVCSHATTIEDIDNSVAACKAAYEEVVR